MINPVHSHVLVLGQDSERLHQLVGLLAHLKCSVSVVDSPDQVFEAVSQAIPCLMILADHRHSCGQVSLTPFRHMANACGTTIVAVTAPHAPNWVHREDYPDIDGFLVEPLSREVLSSLIHAAQARQAYCRL